MHRVRALVGGTNDEHIRRFAGLQRYFNAFFRKRQAFRGRNFQISFAIIRKIDFILRRVRDFIGIAVDDVRKFFRLQKRYEFAHVKPFRFQIFMPFQRDSARLTAGIPRFVVYPVFQSVFVQRVHGAHQFFYVFRVLSEAVHARNVGYCARKAEIFQRLARRRNVAARKIVQNGIDPRRRRQMIENFIVHKCFLVVRAGAPAALG